MHALTKIEILLPAYRPAMNYIEHQKEILTVERRKKGRREFIIIERCQNGTIGNHSKCFNILDLGAFIRNVTNIENKTSDDVRAEVYYRLNVNNAIGMDFTTVPVINLYTVPQVRIYSKF